MSSFITVQAEFASDTLRDTFLAHVAIGLSDSAYGPGFDTIAYDVLDYESEESSEAVVALNGRIYTAIEDLIIDYPQYFIVRDIVSTSNELVEESEITADNLVAITVIF